MNIQNKLSELKDEKSYSGPAKSVKQYLLPILSHSNKLRVRWMWELLQNASDLGDSIKVRIEIDTKKLTYSHNGKNFSLSEAYNLIMPESSKDNEIAKSKSVIGQFGTGFISTHILSKIIQVNGIIEDEEKLYSFNFNLDRSERTDNDFLIDSIKKSEAEYRKNLEEIDELPEDEFHTSFTYQIDNTFSSLKGQEIVNDGIKSFKELIPYALTFRPQLEEIEIIDRRTTTTKLTFKREEIESDIEGLKIIKTIFHENGKHIEDKLIGNIVEDKTEIAFPIKEIEGYQFKLLPFPIECPRLFCAFPMIGTNEFNFPVIIHSESFVPNRERDGIEITLYDEENRKRLIEAKDAFKKLLSIVEKKEWTDAFNICRLLNPDISDIETKTWFVKEIFTAIEFGIYTTKLIELETSVVMDSYRTSFIERRISKKNTPYFSNNVHIPYVGKSTKDSKKVIEKIYDFLFKLTPRRLPRKDHLLNWYDIINFEIDESIKFTIEDLCQNLTYSNLNEFVVDVNFKNEDEAIKYLKDVFEFIINQSQEELLSKYDIIPNQNNVLTNIKKLKLDRTDHKELHENYSEKLKDIYFSLSGKDCRENLLHKEFEGIDNLINKENKFKFQELARNTDEELRVYEGNFNDETFLLVLKNLFNWYTTCGLSEDTLANSFQYFSLNKSQLYLNTKTPQELEYAFDIEISGKSEVLAKLANSSLSDNELEIIADNPELVSNFIEWLNSKQEDNPDEELGNVGEEFLHQQLCKIFGENRVLWENKSEYDFRILEKDLTTTKYYIDAKTTSKGIANSDNVPFFMRMAQWSFLDKQQASDKYIIARIFKNGGNIDVKYLRLNKQSL